MKGETALYSNNDKTVQLLANYRYTGNQVYYRYTTGILATRSNMLLGNEVLVQRLKSYAGNVPVSIYVWECRFFSNQYFVFGKHHKETKLA